VPLNDGERQVAASIDGIRRDHVARYVWAARQLKPGMTVIDAACGVGYGSKILAEAGCFVTAYDRSEEAIAYAREHYAHERINYRCEDVSALGVMRPADAAVCFETIEHIEHPLVLLQSLRAAPLLLASVPNEEKFPFIGYKFHFRHYSRADFASLLQAAGFEIEGWYGQLGSDSNVEPDINGRTAIVTARRAAKPALHLPKSSADAAPLGAPVPLHVAILGLGPSIHTYTDRVMRMGGRKAFCDEVWAINALGNVIDCDRIFHMDQVEIQELRAAEQPNSNIAEMVKWLKTHPGPIYTSIAKEGYPGLVELPIEDMINTLGFAYFNGTAAYAVAYAIYIGVKKISLFGCDYTYKNAHHAEQGRACVEFWLGIAAARGIELFFSDKTSLMDTIDEPPDGELRLYGYDTVKVKIAVVDGSARLTFEPKDVKPTAVEIEDRYDHSKHPSPHLRDNDPRKPKQEAAA